MPRRTASLRRSLAASTGEGLVAEVVGACSSGAVTTAWALHLDLSGSAIALLTALPQASQLAQIPAAHLVARFGARRVALCAVTAARQLNLVLALLPFVIDDPARRAQALVATLVASAGLSVVGNNAWNTWMGELVPARLRGRYFGRRTAVCTIASTLAGLAAGWALGRGAAPPVGVLSGLAIVAALAGAASTWLMARQAATPASNEAPSLAAWLAPFATCRGRGVLGWTMAWHAASGVAGGLLAVYLLVELHGGYHLLALHGSAAALTRSLTARRWGVLIDRVGAQRVLTVSACGLAISPLLWLTLAEDRLWPLAIDALITGVAGSGAGLASFTLPLSASSRQGRGYFLALWAIAGGLAYAASAACGSALVTAWGHAAGGVTAMQVILVLSAALRLWAGRMAWRLPGEAERAPARLATAARAAS